MTLSETVLIVVQTPEVAELWRKEGRDCENRTALLRSITVREAKESDVAGGQCKGVEEVDQCIYMQSRAITGGGELKKVRYLKYRYGRGSVGESN